MQLPNELRKKLADELRYAAIKMSETESPHEKIYYFSVFFGEAARVLNWHWDEELVLLWAMSQHTHNAISSALTRMSQGERVIGISKEHTDALEREAMALADWVEGGGAKHELGEIACRMAEIIFSTTGNGHYLAGRGHFTLAK